MEAYRTRSWRGRSLLGVLAATALAAACTEGTAPDRNLPKAEAEQRESAYPAYQTSPESARVWELDGRRWQSSGVAETIEASLLQSVASADGEAVYALTSDPAPYDRLYTPAGPNRWRVLHAID